MFKPLRIVSVVLASAMMVPAFTPTVVNANPVDQQRQRVEDIVDELERLEEDARRIGEEYVLAIDAQTQLDEEIVEAEARVAAVHALAANSGESRGYLGARQARCYSVHVPTAASMDGEEHASGNGLW